MDSKATVVKDFALKYIFANLLVNILTIQDVSSNVLTFRGESVVWRAFFFAIGIMLLIVGVECLLIDSATLGNVKTETVQVSEGWFQTPRTMQVAKGGRTINPPEWMPWSFIFSGAVVLLYSMTLPARWVNTGG